MVVEARLCIRHHGCWTERLTREHVTLMGGDRHHIISVMHGASTAEVDDYLAARAHDLDAPVTVDRSPTSVVLRCSPPADGVISTIFAFGCTILWPAVYSDGHERYTVLAPTRLRLDGLVDRLKDVGEVRLEKLSEVGPATLGVSVPLSDITTGLTERQLAVLQRAVENGYYESPRCTSTDALAKAFGVSRSTFQEHLRKAEKRVLAKFAGILASHPVLGDNARRKPGRPPRKKFA